MLVRFSSITYNSEANGPGVRNVLHVQGCTIGCKGCFNTHTWWHLGGDIGSVHKLAWMLMSEDESPIDGITISGGEPTEQWPAVSALLKECHKIRPALNVLMFTGITQEQLAEKGILQEAFAPYYLSSSLISTIVSGPYDRDNPSEEYLLGSSNQKILTWDGADLVEKGPRVEVKIEPDGSTTVTGFPGKETIKQLKKHFK